MELCGCISMTYGCILIFKLALSLTPWFVFYELWLIKLSLLDSNSLSFSIWILYKKYSKTNKRKKHIFKEINKNGYPFPTQFKPGIQNPDTRFKLGQNQVAFLDTRIFGFGSTRYPILNTPYLNYSTIKVSLTTSIYLYLDIVN